MFEGLTDADASVGHAWASENALRLVLNNETTSVYVKPTFFKELQQKSTIPTRNLVLSVINLYN